MRTGRRSFVKSAGIAILASVFSSPGGVLGRESTAGREAHRDLQRWIDREREHIRVMMAREDIPGLALCVVCDGKPVWTEAFGVTDRKLGRPVGMDTIFSIQSTSKNVTATAIMLAVQRGLLDLDTPVVRWLPDFKVRSRFETEPERKITLRHLLSHRAGFTHEAPIGNNFDRGFPGFQAHVDSISQTWLRAPVGRRYYYSNLGFDLAGYVLETVSKKPFAQCLKDLIFHPLGMVDATAATDEYARLSNRAIGHVQGFDTVPLEIPFIPSGGVYASIRDMAAYLLFHLNRGSIGGSPVLEPWLWNEMHSFAFPGAYSLGVAGGDLRFGDTDIRMLNHSGGGLGFGSQFLFYPQARLGYAVLFNRATPAGYGLGAGVVDAILVHRYGERKPRIRIEDFAPLSLSPEMLQKFAGSWTGRGINIDLRVTGGALAIHRSQNDVPLCVTSPVEIVMPPDLPGGDATQLRYVSAQKEASAYLESLLGDGNLDYNGGPGDPPGQNRKEWDAYVGDYAIEQWGQRVGQVSIHRQNGYLFLNAIRLSTEAEPGLFFTSDNEAVDFRNGDPTWGNIRLSRAPQG